MHEIPFMGTYLNWEGTSHQWMLAGPGLIKSYALVQTFGMRAPSTRKQVQLQGILDLQH